MLTILNITTEVESHLSFFVHIIVCNNNQLVYSRLTTELHKMMWCKIYNFNVQGNLHPVLQLMARLMLWGNEMVIFFFIFFFTLTAKQQWQLWVLLLGSCRYFKFVMINNMKFASHIINVVVYNTLLYSVLPLWSYCTEYWGFAMLC